MDEGWGRVAVGSLVDGSRSFNFLDQSVLLTTGQIYERKLIITGPGAPLKVTLAYTDVPGFPGAIAALVNDLDLEVVAPDGRIYRGNQFDEGESIPNATTADTINNVEAVHLAAPVPGEYTIRVRARSVVEDSRIDTGAVDQDFALVISGAIPVPGVGTVILDRSAYRAPSVIKITLIDSDLAGQTSASVSARSTTEPGGENVVLTASSSSGIFTGAVASVITRFVLSQSSQTG